MNRRLTALLLTLSFFATEAAETRTIPNQLGLGWPWELVSLDFPAGQLPASGVTTIQGRQRPYQLERLTIDGTAIDRAWFIATVDRIGEGRQARTPETIEVELAAGSADFPEAVTFERANGWLTVRNGVYEFRVADYAANEVAGATLADIRHWCGGMRTLGESAWDGRAWFEGSPKLANATVEILDQGPVKLDLRITYTFAEAGVGEMLRAPRLELGKQSFRWAPNTLPTESIPQRERHYELLLRFTAGDPWIEAVERYRLPSDSAVKDFNVSQWYLHWGKPPAGLGGSAPQAIPANDFMKVDTVTWMRWFLYDRFGGNVTQNWVPATPREDQKGRPFALLRPRWNQGGGGAQDFALTLGDDKTEPEAPAVAVIATFASKWVGPYRGTIPASAVDGERGFARFALSDGGGGGGNDGDSVSNWYGQRSFALVVGRKNDVRNLNSLVRRHTDWTLTAQANHYILDWERDPAKAGPHIIISRATLEGLRRDLAAGSTTAAVTAVREAEAERTALRSEREGLADDDAGKRRRRAIDTVLNGEDMRLLALILGEAVRQPRPPDVGLWIQRRYQDDFLNPTSRPIRALPYDLASADLFADGKPLGGAAQAAIAYVHTDLDAWPGWHNGWSPGNPNFHTDKYRVALYAAAALADHPHAADWLSFGRANFDEDLEKVLLAPDGVGYECPGYAGYSLKMQLKLASLISNLGGGNPVSDNPLFAGTGNWHRKLITPTSTRLGQRHAAPIGDTHRWNSGLGRGGFGMLANFYVERDPAFASELATAGLLLPGGKNSEDGLTAALLGLDPRVQTGDPAQLDWSSQAFFGFGAILRTHFGTPRESFLTLRAGRTNGHYHNDHLSYHYYADATPISLDYNCSYTPRGDHAALHNSMTFGRSGTVTHNGRNESVEAMEQLFGSGRLGACRVGELGQVVVSERHGGSLTLSPVEPNNAEFQRQYPTRQVEGGIVHRRLLAMVTHEAESPFTDYLVVREETQGSEAQQLNIHVLARQLRSQSDGLFELEGQWTHDMLVAVTDSSGLRAETRSWHYNDVWMASPGEQYVIAEGESVAAWNERMQALKREHGVDRLPLPGWKPKWFRQGEQGGFNPHIAATQGRALIPPQGWSSTWLYGEYQVWLRLHSDPGTPLTWVLYPYRAGSERPTIERIADGRGVRISLAGEVEEVELSTAGGVSIRRGARSEVLIPAGRLPALGSLPDLPLAADGLPQPASAP